MLPLLPLVNHRPLLLVTLCLLGNGGKSFAQSFDAGTLIPRRVAAGDHDYDPGHGSSLNRRVRGFDLAFSIPESSWFDPSPQGPIQRDGMDWNKAGGISYLSLFRPGSYPKNRRSALVGTRPGPKPGTFQVCAYTNDAKGKWVTGNALSFAAGDTIYVSARIVDERVTYQIVTPQETQTTVHDLEPLCLAIPVGPWFGGNRESPIDRTIFSRLALVR